MHDSEAVLKQLRKMGKEELIGHALSLHSIVDNLDTVALTYAQQIGRMVRVLTRSSRTVTGVLWSVRFMVDEVSIATEVVERDYEKNATFRELKTVILNKGSIGQLEFIDERDEVPEEREELDDTIDGIEAMLNGASN